MRVLDHLGFGPDVLDASERSLALLSVSGQVESTGYRKCFTRAGHSNDADKMCFVLDDFRNISYNGIYYFGLASGRVRCFSRMYVIDTAQIVFLLS